MTSYHYKTFPKSRIATFDVYSVARLKHHIAVLLECNVSGSREKLKQLKSKGQKVSFNGWLLKVISSTIKNHPEVASYLYNKRKLIIFDDLNVSTVVEKNIDGEKVPIPLIIEKANEKSVYDITKEIEVAKNKEISGKDIVLNNNSTSGERMYYLLPKFIRIKIWKYMLRHPKVAHKKMGNVIVTSLGMIGQINGWFIHKSVHPISIGIGSIIKKPIIINEEIQIREVLNMTVLIDHDAVDGAPMARFIKELAGNIENGLEL